MHSACNMHSNWVHINLQNSISICRKLAYDVACIAHKPHRRPSMKFVGAREKMKQKTNASRMFPHGERERRAPTPLPINYIGKLVFVGSWERSLCVCVLQTARCTLERTGHISPDTSSALQFVFINKYSTIKKNVSVNFGDMHILWQKMTCERGRETRGGGKDDKIIIKL